ncbi:MAG: heat shock protein HtpX [Gaiellaceae bacterium]|nr:heat shock protein HtpX [Gaiellaceae bacterium]MDX6436141.1 heat shock protein HtpX [Gaiellaceae bacterium]
MGGRLVIVRNVLKAWAFLLGTCAVLGLVGWALGGYRLLSIFVFCGVLLASALYWYADRVAVGLVGARELPVGESPGLHSTLERLAAVAGVAKPRLYLIDDGLPRALAAGRGPRGSALAVSTGLLTAASPAELEGVLAHELAHVRHRDVVVQTSVVVLAATLLELSRVGGWFQRALLWFLGPLASAFVHLLLSPKREFLADRAAATICASPHPLADALVRLDQASELVSFQGSPATEPLYTINPFLEEGLAALFVTHPPVGERVRRLRELDPDWREKLRAA